MSPSHVSNKTNYACWGLGVLPFAQLSLAEGLRTDRCLMRTNFEFSH